MLFNQQYRQQRKKGSILVPKPVAAHSPYWCSCQHNKYCITNIYYSYYRKVWFIMQANERLVELAILVLLVQLQHTLRTCAAVTITDWWQVYTSLLTPIIYTTGRCGSLCSCLNYTCTWDCTVYIIVYGIHRHFGKHIGGKYTSLLTPIIYITGRCGSLCSCLSFTWDCTVYIIVYSGKWNPQTFGIWQTMECTNMCGI